MATSLRLAIFFHFGNHSLYNEFRKYINNIYATGHNIDLYISYQVYTPLLENFKRDFINTYIVETKLGMDIGGKLSSFSVALKNKKEYDYFISLHTKSDIDWRRTMTLPICGTTEAVHKCLDIFQKTSNVGMIGSSTKTFHISFYNITHSIQERFCQKWNIKYQGNNSNIHFVGGTIFWMRWKLLSALISEKNIDILAEYNSLEPGYVSCAEPTLTHAWERMFGIIVYHYGQIISPINIQSLNLFNPRYYLEKYPDLRANGITSDHQALQHYIFFGYMEGRTPI